MCLRKIRAKKSHSIQTSQRASKHESVFSETLAAAARNKKKKQTGFQTVQDGKKISIHEVHMYRIG
jgi:hypothetical protein